MELTLAQVIEATGAEIAGRAPLSTRTNVSGWSIDSRTIAPGELFFALRGEVHDGHAFVQPVLQRGAIAAVVEDATVADSGTLLVVKDTLAALTDLARFARGFWGQPIVAVTGSAGKTSTKDIIAELLRTRFITGKTVGNFNNHIGLPLSVLRIPDRAELAVLEMGMNHAGEIRHLCGIAQPQVGVVTNVGYAHVEFFNSIEGVAAAKRELIESLSADGTAVLNADDERVLAFGDYHKGRTITYGVSTNADVRASSVTESEAGTTFTVDGVEFTTELQGEHSVRNILAGIAVCRHFGIAAAELAAAVRNLAAGKMRGQRAVRNGITIFNDCYNSNPEAARSMLAVLRREPATRHIAVLGEMLELGSMSEALHRSVGRYAAEIGLDVLVGIQGASRAMADEAMAAGMPSQNVFFFDNSGDAGQFLREYVKPGDAILFKGSRGVRVENALATIEG